MCKWKMEIWIIIFNYLTPCECLCADLNKTLILAVRLLHLCLFLIAYYQSLWITKSVYLYLYLNVQYMTQRNPYHTAELKLHIAKYR